MNQVVAISNVNAWPLDKNDEDLPSVKEKGSAILWHLCHVLYKYSRVHGHFFPTKGQAYGFNTWAMGRCLYAAEVIRFRVKVPWRTRYWLKRWGGGGGGGDVWECFCTVGSSDVGATYAVCRQQQMNASFYGNELEQGDCFIVWKWTWARKQYF